MFEEVGRQLKEVILRTIAHDLYSLGRNWGFFVVFLAVFTKSFCDFRNMTF